MVTVVKYIIFFLWFGSSKFSNGMIDNKNCLSLFPYFGYYLTILVKNWYVLQIDT